MLCMDILGGCVRGVAIDAPCADCVFSGESYMCVVVGGALCVGDW